MGQSKSRPFGLDNDLLSELSVIMEGLRHGYKSQKECLAKIDQVYERLNSESTDKDIEYIRQLTNEDITDKEQVCSKLLSNYSLRLELIEKIDYALKYATRRFQALMTGPQCVNESPYVTEDMDVPSADLTEQECLKSRNDQMNRIYMWKQRVEPPDESDPVNAPWYNIIRSSYDDINTELLEIKNTLEKTIDEDTLEKISRNLDVIIKNAENAYVGAIKFIYSQYKAAREERAMQMAADPVSPQKGGGKMKRNRAK